MASRHPKFRFHDVFPHRSDKTCRCRCGQPITGRQRSWASEACRKAALEHFLILKGDSQTIRRVIFARDKGVCVLCALDTQAAREKCRGWDPERAAEVNRERMLRMTQGFPDPYETWWQADHIVELADGGRNAVENLRTLCVVCHAKKTANQATMRAARRRASSPKFRGNSVFVDDRRQRCQSPCTANHNPK